jgi:hypothetical protein
MILPGVSYMGGRERARNFRIAKEAVMLMMHSTDRDAGVAQLMVSVALLLPSLLEHARHEPADSHIS